jgi:hypothetical protein
MIVGVIVVGLQIAGFEILVRNFATAGASAVILGFAFKDIDRILLVGVGLQPPLQCQ